MYTHPRATKYTSGELIDLLGPVETQYCGLNSITATPDVLIHGKRDPTVSLNGVVVTCPAFSDIQVRLLDSNSVVLDTESFVPSDGQTQSINWETIYDFSNIILDPGDYTIEVTVTDSNNCSSDPVSTPISVN